MRIEPTGPFDPEETLKRIEADRERIDRLTDERIRMIESAQRSAENSKLRFP